jgi:hypothetical protein
VDAIGFEEPFNSLPLATLRTRVVGSTFNPEEELHIKIASRVRDGSVKKLTR